MLARLDPRLPLCVFVHGNRMKAVEAVGQGLLISERIRQCRSSIDEYDSPLQFVTWSWPSEIITGPIRDARSKAVRSDQESFYLASFLADLPPEQNVCIVGYSFGARVASGAVHLLAGGQLAGNQLAQPNNGCRPRVVLLAAAYPGSWLSPAGTHGLTLHQASNVTSFFNPRDPALKHYEFVFRRDNAFALGYRGVSVDSLGPAGLALTQYNVEAVAGRSHSLNRFVDSTPIMSTVSLQVYGG